VCVEYFREAQIGLIKIVKLIHRLGMGSQLQTKVLRKGHLKSARNFVFGRRWYTEGRMQGEVSAT
jgi:hypothetical protein